jgi:hypothetical protein
MKVAHVGDASATVTLTTIGLRSRDVLRVVQTAIGTQVA